MAGNGSFYFFSGDGGPAFTASVNKPVSLAVDGAGSLCVADLASNAIRILRATGCSLLIGALLDAASQNAGPETPGKIVANPRRGSRARRPFEADSGAGSAARGAAHSDRRFAGRGRVLPGIPVWGTHISGLELKTSENQLRVESVGLDYEPGGTIRYS